MPRTSFMFIHCPTCGSYCDMFSQDRHDRENFTETCCQECGDVWNVSHYTNGEFWRVDQIEWDGNMNDEGEA